MPTVVTRERPVWSPMGVGTVTYTETCLTNEEFEEMLSGATSFAELLQFFTEEFSWEAENAEDEDSRLFEKAFGFITTTSQAAQLYDTNSSPEIGRDERLFEKMLELASDRADLDIIYYRLAIEECEIRRRDFIRKLFDKADAIGYPKE